MVKDTEEYAMIEMYMSGVLVHRVEGITEALRGTRVSAGVVSKVNKQVHKKIEA